MNDQDLNGLILPVVTPYKLDGMLSEAYFIKHLEFISSCGVNKILLNGTTGEFFSMTTKERTKIVRLARENFAGRIFVNISCWDIYSTLKHFEELQKYSPCAVVCLPPCYPAEISEKGLVEYFQTLIERINLPFILYNFPKHTKNAITPRILSELGHFGIKDSSGNLELIRYTPRYYIGGDLKIINCLSNKGKGFVSGHANYAPETYVQMEKAFLQNDTYTMQETQKQINNLLSGFKDTCEISGIKKLIARKIDNFPIKVRVPLI